MEAGNRADLLGKFRCTEIFLLAFIKLRFRLISDPIALATTRFIRDRRAEIADIAPSPDAFFGLDVSAFDGGLQGLFLGHTAGPEQPAESGHERLLIEGRLKIGRLFQAAAVGEILQERKLLLIDLAGLGRLNSRFDP